MLAGGVGLGKGLGLGEVMQSKLVKFGSGYGLAE